METLLATARSSVVFADGTSADLEWRNSSQHDSMISSPEDDNPYLTPMTTSESDVARSPRPSKVGLCAFVGGIGGVIFQIILQLSVVDSPSGTVDGILRQLNELHPPELIGIVVWASISASLFAILGSIAGAMLDMCFSFGVEHVGEQSDAPKSPVGREL